MKGLPRHRSAGEIDNSEPIGQEKTRNPDNTHAEAVVAIATQWNRRRNSGVDRGSAGRGTLRLPNLRQQSEFCDAGLRSYENSAVYDDGCNELISRPELIT